MRSSFRTPALIFMRSVNWNPALTSTAVVSSPWSMVRRSPLAPTLRRGVSGIQNVPPKFSVSARVASPGAE